jgi:hypothetical protein
MGVAIATPFPGTEWWKLAEDRNFIDQYIQITKNRELPLSEESLDEITDWDH